MGALSVVQSAVAAFACGAAMAACSTDTAPQSATPAPLSFQPSPASQSELGVVVWNVASTGPYSSTVKGLASDGTVAAELDSTMFADASGNRHVTLSYTHGTDAATVDIATQGSDGAGTLQVNSTEAAGAAPVPLGLQLLTADVAAGVPVAFSAVGVQLEGDPFASTLRPQDGDLVRDGGALVQGSSCPLVQQCGALGQTLDCAKNAYSLTDCSVKGLVQPLEKGIQLVVGLFGKAKAVTNLVQCPTSINNFFDTCLASNPNGSEKTFGNSACDDVQNCTTAGCTSGTPACIDSPNDGEVCGPNGTFCAQDYQSPDAGDSFCCSRRCGMTTAMGSTCY